MSVALLHAMHSLSCQGPRQIAPCTMRHQSTLDLHVYTVLLTRSLAHCSYSWPTELDQAVLTKQRTHAHCPLQMQY